ncbi:MAG: hypothetical protein JWL91_1338 [Sphingomonas bacterium]|nr:murein L,D-transpeptidase catalytic domain family protein [Sphingomonas bacterium]MDB5689462.1 hypothetical protein [Sphingomonas bacterium]
MNAMLPSRRALLRSGLLAAAGLACPARAAEAAEGVAAAAPGIDPILREQAMAALARHESAIWSRDVIAIVDFGLPSSVPRFHLVDLLRGDTTTLLVAHGRGSDPDHTGMLQSFSNVEGSQATSEGAYLIGEAYSGIHGPARRLIGMDPTDDQADPRAIVIHAAWYVGPEIVARQGRLGRSDGCFAVSQADIGQVLARLGRGRLLYAGRSRAA